MSTQYMCKKQSVFILKKLCFEGAFLYFVLRGNSSFQQTVQSPERTSKKTSRWNPAGRKYQISPQFCTILHRFIQKSDELCPFWKTLQTQMRPRFVFFLVRPWLAWTWTLCQDHCKHQSHTCKSCTVWLIVSLLDMLSSVRPHVGLIASAALQMRSWWKWKIVLIKYTYVGNHLCLKCIKLEPAIERQQCRKDRPHEIIRCSVQLDFLFWNSKHMNSTCHQSHLGSHFCHSHFASYEQKMHTRDIVGRAISSDDFSRVFLILNEFLSSVELVQSVCIYAREMHFLLVGYGRRRSKVSGNNDGYSVCKSA